MENINTIKENIKNIKLDIAKLGSSKKHKIQKTKLNFEIDNLKEQIKKLISQEKEEIKNKELEEKKFEKQNRQIQLNKHKSKLEELKTYNEDETILKNNVYNLLLDQNPNTKIESYLEAEELLVKHLIKKYHIKTIKQDEKEESWAYLSGIYVNYGRSLCKEELRKILNKAYHKKFFNSIFEKVIAETFILPKDFYTSNHEFILPVQNGLLDVKNRCLLPFDPKYIFFSKLPMNYNPHSTCEHIEKHLLNVLENKDDILLFQETIGNCLLKNYKFQKAVMMIGKGRNGKGVTLDLINHFLGIENCASLTLQDLEGDGFELSVLHGKLANTAGDLSGGVLSETGPFKKLTGGDLITAKRKFLGPIYFTNYAKLFFACNELPESKDETDGFFDRWIIFNFPYKFVPKQQLSKNNPNYKQIDTNLKDKLFTETELEGFLNFALVGLDRLLKNNYFSSSKTTDNIKDTWNKNSNSAMAFVVKQLAKSITAEPIKTSIILDKYHEFCETENLRPLSQSNLTKLLYSQYGSIKKQVRDSKDSSEKYYVYTNISFNKKTMETLK